MHNVLYTIPTCQVCSNYEILSYDYQSIAIFTFDISSLNMPGQFIL